MIRKLSVAAIILLLIVGGWLWLKPSHAVPVKPYVQPETAIRGSQPTAPVDSTDSAEAVTSPPLSVPITNPPLLDINSNSYPAGLVQTKTFMTPAGNAYTWAVNFHYDSPDPSGSVTVQVYQVDASGYAILSNFVVQSPASPSGEFSFFEQFMGNVFLRVNAGKWHLSVTPASGYVYPLVATETTADSLCVKNKLGQCSAGP